MDIGRTLGFSPQAAVLGASESDASQVKLLGFAAEVLTHDVHLDRL